MSTLAESAEFQRATPAPGRADAAVRRMEPPVMPEREIVPDDSRQARIGFDETIYCAGKSTLQIETIVARGVGSNRPLLLTRLEAGSFEALGSAHRAVLDYDPVSRTAVLGTGTRSGAGPARVAVVTAGTSDVPVAKEAVRTLAYYGEPALEVYDVGVAGLWRLLERLEEIRAMPVVIAIAGMEASLPSVVGGQVPGLVVAVPTSNGYGVSVGGRVALDASLSSCAPGLAVVNIDNGYGAACVALRALRGAG
ncbi:MAG: nickel pincer cofactor biosynthesis protein LarB [Thiotrichales bacterium]|nr:nickel pincer cofactor biosynthesis protein LarB [Thiotrichales bacterium]MCY4350107.1 nickel pincer cofactor biosynthesis protein LarB [Thiotrichales bacterium]